MNRLRGLMLGGLVTVLATAHCALASAVVGTQFTWTGLAPIATPNWSSASNWTSGAPTSAQSIDMLEFPDLSGACNSGTQTCTTSTNDLTALSVGAMSIDGPGYQLAGNAINLGSGGLSTTATAATNTLVNIPFALTADQTWSISGVPGSSSYQALATVQQPVTGSGHALTIHLANHGFLGLVGAGNDVGAIDITGTATSPQFPDDNGSVAVTSALNSTSGHAISVTRAALQPNGTVGPLSIHSGGLRVGFNPGTRTVSTPSLTLDATSTTSFYIFGTGSTAGTDYSQLQSTGAISLAGAPQVSDQDPSCAVLTLGHTYRFMSTTGTLSGTFSGNTEIPITPYPGCTSTGRDLQLSYDATGVTATVVAVSGDTTPPTITITSPIDGQHYAFGTTINASYSCADAGGSGIASCTASTIDPSVGTHAFTVNATDVATNTNTKTIHYTVDATADTTAPTITITSPVDGHHYAPGASIAADFSCDDGDGSGVDTCDALTGIDTSVGTHAYTVAATDFAGNSSSKTVHYTVDAVADTTPPAITITAPVEGAHFALASVQNAVASCTDAGGSGIATCDYVAGLDTSTPGARTFTVVASDNAGNSATKSVNYVVDPDTTPPTIAITSPADGQHYTFGAGIPALYDCADTGGSQIDSCGALTAIDPSVGTHVFTVRATDGAGNVTLKSSTYTVDAPAPSGGGASGAGGSSGGGTSPVGGGSGGTTPTGGGTSTGTGAGGAAATTPKFASTSRASVLGIARGVTVSISGLKPGSTVELRVRRGPRTIKIIKATASAAGKATLKIKLTRAQLRTLKGKTLTLRYATTAANGKKKVIVRTLKVV